MYHFKIVKGTQILATATTLQDAQTEAKRTGGTVMVIETGGPALEALRQAVAHMRPERANPAAKGAQWTRHDKHFCPPFTAGAKLVASVDGVAVASWKGGVTHDDQLGLEAATRDWIASKGLPNPYMVLVEKVDA